MIRTYEDGTTINADYFIGVEVENLPTKGQKTFFVAVKIDSLEIKRRVDATDCTAIYLGANHYFINLKSEEERLDSLNEIVRLASLVDQNLVVDVPLSMYDMIFSYKSLIENPQISFNFSIRTPYIKSFKNVFFKLDDIGFEATNPGVWVTSPNQIEDSGGFNDWLVYKQDSLN